ncbi:MAG: FeoA family protein [Anaerolineae bacterium]|nr:ferrous iron transport protein A [Anaerolineae bacterium]MCX8067245.1 ferrous iron transport protein A [Anaerolineae bacterium]MDW7992252.1 FeoA family protein [Anaerolineae bacterium]
MANGGAAIPLNLLHTGERGKIAQLTGGQELRNRMLALGLTPGAEVTVLQNYGRGPMLVRVRDVRVALGRGEAANVLVQRGEG